MAATEAVLGPEDIELCERLSEALKPGLAALPLGFQVRIHFVRPLVTFNPVAKIAHNHRHENLSIILRGGYIEQCFSRVRGGSRLLNAPMI